MSYEYLICDIDQNVAIVTINRPPVNPLNSDVFQELNDLFDELDSNDDVRAIVLTGSGEKAFVAGADVKEMATKDLVSLNQMKIA